MAFSASRFPQLFFLVVFLYYAVVVVLNTVVDPFFQLTQWKGSLAEPAVSRPYNEILMKAGRFRDSGATRIVTGDSRAFPFTAERFAQHGSAGWFPFGIGGGHIREIVDAVHFAARNADLQEVVLVMPMRMFVERQGNRFPEALDLASRPPLYLTNSLVTRASLGNLWFRLSGRALKTQQQEGSRDEAWRYWLDHMRLQTAVWQEARDGTQGLLQDLFVWLRAEGIAFTILLPPIHDDLTDIYQRHLPGQYQRYRAFFLAQPETLDCALAPFTADRNRFRDPLHFDEVIADQLVPEVLTGGGTICHRPSP